MNYWRSILVWLVRSALLRLVLSQEDLCEPSSGYELFLRLNEDAEIGTVVTTLGVSGSSDSITLTMTPDRDSRFAFNASTQEVYVQRQLDADNGTDYYGLRISCTEANKAPVSIFVSITLVDVNDNAPKFAKDQYYITMGETTTAGQIVDTGAVATDSDTTFVNSAVAYTVQDGPYSDYFQFPDALAPSLALRKMLDYESVPNMTITVVATNELSTIKLNSTTLLTILVQDEDDLNPVFTNPLYQGMVLETAGMNTVVNVTPPIHAADEDATLNEPVVYSFHDAQGPKNVFAIDPATAEVRLVGSIRPTKVSIVVQATQKDNPSRYGVAMLVITVAGVSSNAPQFQSDRYQVYVSEAVPLGTTVLFVSATDKDFGAVIRYSIVGDNNLFAIDSNSGAINVTGRLDFETAPRHNFTVMASDGSMDSTATVEVKVGDTNDNAPIIPDQQLSFELERTTGAVITTITAQDSDAGTRLQFRLVNYDSLFSIDESGKLRISAKSSELTDSEYLILVVVSDDGEPPRERPVFVTVKFPPLLTTAPVVMAAGPSDDTLAIALGVVAAVLLVVVIILLVYICRRRNQTSEQLDKARANRSPDPRGLKFKNANRSNLNHIHFQGDDSSDGATTVQENPLKAGSTFNYGFVHPDDPESDRNMDEIHIETAVIPYRQTDMYNNNDEMYQHEDSSEYGDSLPHKHSLVNGLYPGTSSESLSTSQTNSSLEGMKQQLMGNGTTSFGTTSFGKAGGSSGGGSAMPAISLEGLDPDVSVAPQEQKSELTVYF